MAARRCYFMSRCETAALAELARLAGDDAAPEAEAAALAIVRGLLGAEDAFLVDGSRGTYVRYGGAGDDALSDTAIWLIQRALIAAGEPRAFRLRGGMPEFAASLTDRRRIEYVAALVPAHHRPAYVFVARGPWQRGLGQARTALLVAALPAFGRLVDRRHAVDAALHDRELFSTIEAVSVADGIEAMLSRGARMT